jgi:hypothetical protein
MSPPPCLQMLDILVRTTRLPLVTLVDSEAGCVKLHGMLQIPALTRRFVLPLGNTLSGGARAPEH